MSMNYTPLKQTVENREEFDPQKLDSIDQKIKQLLQYFAEYPQLKKSVDTLFQRLNETKKLMDQWRTNKVPTTKGDGDDTKELKTVREYLITTESLILAEVSKLESKNVKRK